MRQNLTFLCILCVLVIGGEPQAVGAEANSAAGDDSRPNGNRKFVKDAIRKLFTECAVASDLPPTLNIDSGFDGLTRSLSRLLAAEA